MVTTNPAAAATLLTCSEPAALTIEYPHGNSDIVLTCDHASQRLPQALGTLGLPASELDRHIAWDIGAAGVARHLAARLDAPLLLQNYSRLVVDCNRPLHAADLVPTLSESTRIPGNAGLTPAEMQARIREIFEPYHDGLRQLLDARQQAGRNTLLVAVHSFTPTYKGVSRPWHIGMMHHRDARLARSLIASLCQDDSLVVGDNQPYAMGDHSDYTLPVHGEARGLAHVGIEIRQDLIGDAAGQLHWAERLASALSHAARNMLI